jgi:transposase
LTRGTDRNDARGIAQILRTGWYREVYVKSLESHYVRTLLASRKALLRKCIDLENEVRGLLKVFGIKLRAGIRHGAFDAATREPIEANAMLAHALISMKLAVRTSAYQHKAVNPRQHSGRLLLTQNGPPSIAKAKPSSPIQPMLVAALHSARPAA